MLLVIVIVIRFVDVHAWLKCHYSLSCGGFPNSMLASHPTPLSSAETILS